MRLSLLITSLITISCCAAKPYKILVYSPSFSQSINNYIGNIADILAEAGHDVTTVVPLISTKYRVGTDKSARMIYVNASREVNELASKLALDDSDLFNYDYMDVFSAVPFGHDFVRWFNAQCAAVLDEPGLIEGLRRDAYDVMIVENFEACGTALSHLIAPRALITTAGSVPMAWQGHDLGLDPTLSYNPSPLIAHLDVHSFWSRAWNVYASAVFDLTWWTTRSPIDDLFRARYGADYPSIKQIASNAAFSFINSEPLIDYATPTISRIAYIGGIGAKEPRPVDEELSGILSLRNRTVFISLGSIVMSHTLPLAARQSIAKTIARFPEVTFLWKYERPEDEFAKEALASIPNLRMRKWLPQNDLLADPRLTAFITHGGMASTQEVALRGKPGLFIPFFCDQLRNSGMMEKNGVGKIFNKLDLLNAEKLHAAVADLLENESYLANAERIAAMIRRKPFSAKDLLVKTVEFAAEFGPSASLRPQSFDMTWIEYHNADVALALATVLLLLSIASVTVIAKLVISLSRTITFKVKVD